MLAQHRSSTTAPSTGFADSDTNGTSNSLAAPWGNTIWTFKPEASKLRDYGSHGTIKQSTSDEKSGSSLLLKGSQAWGSRPNVSSSRSFTDTRQLDTKSVEQRQSTTGSSYQVLSSIENKSPTSTRPPTINLTNSNFPTRVGRKNGFSVHENKPPTLYTKLTAADPAIDSARTVSPTDTRTGRRRLVIPASHHLGTPITSLSSRKQRKVSAILLLTHEIIRSHHHATCPTVLSKTELITSYLNWVR
jgi:hypothetical protein